MRITVKGFGRENDIGFLQPNKQDFVGKPSAVLLPEKTPGGYINNRICTENSDPRFAEILDKLAATLPPQRSGQESESATSTRIECLLTVVLFMSAKFFPVDSIEILIPLEVCRLLDGLVKLHKESISIVSESECVSCYEVHRSFLECNEIYSSEHSRVYRFLIHGGHCSIKVRASALNNGSLFLTNDRFQGQTIIQKTLFRANMEMADFKALLCMEYIDGLQLHGMLSVSQEEALLLSVLSASKTMQRIQCPEACYETISQKIASCVKAAGDVRTANLGKCILKYWDAETGEAPYPQLCLYDLHRDNLILSQDGWHSIDADTPILGTDSFMFSCLLAASFLMEGYPPRYLIERAISAFPEQYQRVVMEIIVRLYIGISFFSRQSEDESLFRRYVDALDQFALYLQKQKGLFSEPFKAHLRRALETCQAIMNDRK